MENKIVFMKNIFTHLCILVNSSWGRHTTPPYHYAHFFECGKGDLLYSSVRLCLNMCVRVFEHVCVCLKVCAYVRVSAGVCLCVCLITCVCVCGCVFESVCTT